MNSHFLFVRLAGEADEQVVEAHIKMAVEESSRYRGTFSTVTPSGEPITLIAGVGSTAFGSLSASSHDGKYTIRHVFVVPEAREIGIGDTLVTELLRIGRTKNIRWVGATAQPGDRAMKNLYERHGLVAQTIVVGKSLSDPSTAEHASQ